MPGRNPEQFNPDEQEAQNIQTEPSAEFSDAEKAAFEKIVDFEKQTDIGITSLGFGKIGVSPDTHFLSGLLNTERVLRMGLLPRAIAERAEAKISKYGYLSDDTTEGKKAERFVYAFPLNKPMTGDAQSHEHWNFSTIKNELAHYLPDDTDYASDERSATAYKRKLNRIKDWFLAINLKDEDVQDNILYGYDKFDHHAVKEDWGIKIPGRIIPEKILGVVIDEEMVDLDVRAYFSGLKEPEGAINDYDIHDFSWYEGKEEWYDIPPEDYRSNHMDRDEGYYWDQNVKSLYSERQLGSITVLNIQLADTIRLLDIELSEAENETLKNINEKINSIELSFRELESKYNEATKDPGGWEGGDLDFPVQKAIAISKRCELRLQELEIYLEKLLKDPRFTEISTLGKYLSELGEKFKIPIYYMHSKTKEELEAEAELFEAKIHGISGKNRQLAIYDFQNTRQYHSVGLFWPYKMSPKGLKEYINQRAKSKEMGGENA